MPTASFVIISRDFVRIRWTLSVGRSVIRAYGVALQRSEPLVSDRMASQERCKSSRVAPPPDAIIRRQSSSGRFWRSVLRRRSSRRSRSERPRLRAPAITKPSFLDALSVESAGPGGPAASVRRSLALRAVLIGSRLVPRRQPPGRCETVGARDRYSAFVRRRYRCTITRSPSASVTMSVQFVNPQHQGTMAMMGPPTICSSRRRSALLDCTPYLSTRFSHCSTRTSCSERTTQPSRGVPGSHNWRS